MMCSVCLPSLEMLTTLQDHLFCRIETRDMISVQESCSSESISFHSGGLFVSVLLVEESMIHATLLSIFSSECACLELLIDSVAAVVVVATDDVLKVYSCLVIDCTIKSFAIWVEIYAR